jgi:ribosome-binding protein aMBF1 (putative translation factor)
MINSKCFVCGRDYSIDEEFYSGWELQVCGNCASILRRSPTKLKTLKAELKLRDLNNG